MSVKRTVDDFISCTDHLCITDSPRGDTGPDRWYLAKKGWKFTDSGHETSVIWVHAHLDKSDILC